MRNSIHIMLFIRVNIIIRLKRLSVSHVVQSMNNLTDLKIWRLSASNCLTIAWWLPELTAKLRKNWLKQRWQDNFSFIRLHTANPSLKIDLYTYNNEHKAVLPSIQQMKMKAPKGNFLVIFDWFHCKLSLQNVSLLKFLVTIIIKKTEFWLNIAPFNAEFFQLLKQQFTKLRCRRFFTYEDCCARLVPWLAAAAHVALGSRAALAGRRQ